MAGGAVRKRAQKARFLKLKIKNYELRIMKRIMIITVIAGMAALTSCNVTRTVTTRSEAWQKGDTSVVIQTKTIETYDASKKL